MHEFLKIVSDIWWPTWVAIAVACGGFIGLIIWVRHAEVKDGQLKETSHD